MIIEKWLFERDKLSIFINVNLHVVHEVLFLLAQIVF